LQRRARWQWQFSWTDSCEAPGDALYRRHQTDNL